jgi:hypothetical protein
VQAGVCVRTCAAVHHPGPLFDLGIKVDKLGRTKRSGVTGHNLSDSVLYLRTAHHIARVGDTPLLTVLHLLEIMRGKPLQQWAPAELANTLVAYDRWYNGVATNEIVCQHAGSLLTTEQWARSLPFVMDPITPTPHGSSSISVYTDGGPVRYTAQVTDPKSQPYQTDRRAGVTVEFAGVGSGKTPFAMRHAGRADRARNLISIECE